jgi:hypothetical protein
LLTNGSHYAKIDTHLHDNEDTEGKKMTKFKREDFRYHGGYLTYEGDHGAATTYWGDDAHPTKANKPRRDMFIARFKYTSRDKARFVTFLINNFSVEEYAAAMRGSDPTNPWGNPFSPATILEAKGYVSATVRKSMKAAGYTVFNRETYREYFEAKSRTAPCAEYWAQVDEQYAACREVMAAA